MTFPKLALNRQGYSVLQFTFPPRNVNGIVVRDCYEVEIHGLLLLAGLLVVFTAVLIWGVGLSGLSNGIAETAIQRIFHWFRWTD